MQTLFFFNIYLKWSLRISFSWKSHENVLKNPLTVFHGHENSDFGFHGAKLSHEISMRFFTSYFHGPWKVYRAMNMDFHGSWKSHIFQTDTFHDSWKGGYSLACISWVMMIMGDNGPWNSHEGTIKNPWKCPTHTSTKVHVDVNALEKCCTHLLICNSSRHICLNLGQ